MQQILSILFLILYLPGGLAGDMEIWHSHHADDHSGHAATECCSSCHQTQTPAVAEPVSLAPLAELAAAYFHDHTFIPQPPLFAFDRPPKLFS